MKVLIVDDILLNRYLIKETIKKLGFQFCEAENGKKAIELLNEQKFDVVFLDIEMPVMNGIETARAIRKLNSSNKNVKIVAITAYNPSIIHEEFNMMDFDMTISKPYSIEKIILALKEK